VAATGAALLVAASIHIWAERGVDVAESRRSASEVGDGELTEMASSNGSRSGAGRLLGAAECRAAASVVELLEPESVTVTPQWVRSEPQVRESCEQAGQTSVDAGQPVAVEPEVDQSSVEREESDRLDAVEQAVVQIESRYGQLFEGGRIESDATIAVQKEMLESESVEASTWNDDETIVAEVEPSETDEIEECSNLDRQ